MSTCASTCLHWIELSICHMVLLSMAIGLFLLHFLTLHDISVSSIAIQNFQISGVHYRNWPKPVQGVSMMTRTRASCLFLAFLFSFLFLLFCQLQRWIFVRLFANLEDIASTAWHLLSLCCVHSFSSALHKEDVNEYLKQPSAQFKHVQSINPESGIARLASLLIGSWINFRCHWWYCNSAFDQKWLYQIQACLLRAQARRRSGRDRLSCPLIVHSTGAYVQSLRKIPLQVLMTISVRSNPLLAMYMVDVGIAYRMIRQITLNNMN